MLKVDNLTLFHLENKEKHYLLKDIKISINSGDCLGIISKTGDGKSTLAKALLKIYDKNIYLESGSVSLNGKEVDNSHRGKDIILIFQNPNSYLNPTMKVGKQIDEMLIYHHKENKKTSKEKALALMEEVGIENAKEIYSYYPHEISGGMQQKICLCIALICNPKVIILDEFTSYLDKTSKINILRIIKKLQLKRKFTLIIISHDFKEIYNMCNKIAIMRKGQLIEIGDKDEIILNPVHPYTIELLLDYLRYYDNIPGFTCPTMEIEQIKPAPLTHVNDNHDVRSWYLDERSIKLELPSNFRKLKEKIYETLRN